MLQRAMELSYLELSENNPALETGVIAAAVAVTTSTSTAAAGAGAEDEEDEDAMALRLAMEISMQADESVSSESSKSSAGAAITGTLGGGNASQVSSTPSASMIYEDAKSGLSDPSFVSSLLEGVDIDLNDPLIQAALAQIAASELGTPAADGGDEGKDKRKREGDGDSDKDSPSS